MKSFQTHLAEGAFKRIDTDNKEAERLRKERVDKLKARDKGMPKPNDTAKLTTARPKMIKDDENLQELSKDTLKSYRAKSENSYRNARTDQDNDEFVKGYGGKMKDVHGQKKFRERPKSAREKTKETLIKRSKGIAKANKKLVKEDNQAPSTRKIIRILASDNPSAQLKEATYGVLSQKAGRMLDERKQVIARTYFGQDLSEGAFKSIDTDNKEKERLAKDKPIRDIVKRGLDGDRKRAAAKKQKNRQERQDRSDPAAGEWNWS